MHQSTLEVFFASRSSRGALAQAQQHAHDNARQFAEVVAHMVLDDIMHHLAMARPVAWVAWKLSEQRTAK